MNRISVGAAAGLLAGLAVPASAAEMAEMKMATVEPSLSDGMLKLSPGKDAGIDGEATLSISGPGDFFSSAVGKADAAQLDLKGAKLEDGTYTYQLAAPSKEAAKLSESRQALDDGREDAQRVEPRVPVVLSGTFIVENGEVVVPTAAPEKVEGGHAGDDQDK